MVRSAHEGSSFTLVLSSSLLLVTFRTQMCRAEATKGVYRHLKGHGMAAFSGKVNSDVITINSRIRPIPQER